jgi:protein-S-isoprenylcysteine O-methyltransferase Ste14
MLQTGTAAGIVVGSVSAIAIVTTVQAWRDGMPDDSYGGVFVAGCYLLPLLLIPAAESAVISKWVLWFLFAAQCVVKVYLGKRCTITGPVFVRVEASGPYAIVRHPMTAIELAMVGAVIGGNGCNWNMAVMVATVFAKVASVAYEERFLMMFHSYRQYAKKVKARIVPGVF